MGVIRIAAYVRGPFPAAFALFKGANGYAALDGAFFVGSGAFRCILCAFHDLCLGHDAEVSQFLFHVLHHGESFAVGVYCDFRIQRMADGLLLTGFFQGLLC